MNAVVKFAVVCAGVYFFAQFVMNPSSNPLGIKAVESQCAISYEQYQRLTTNMRYADVVRIIGCDGREMSRSDMAGYSTVMYGWDGRGGIGANMNAMFQNDGLVNKAQFGLK